MKRPFNHRSNGKLLLSGEYLVLKGARAIALPTLQGQTIHVKPLQENMLEWEVQVLGKVTSQIEIRSNDWENLSGDASGFSERLVQTLKVAQQMNPYFLKEGGARVVNTIDFNTEWGLGTSSTFIANVAAWAGVDAFELNKQIFKGSGYDIACALADTPILYQLKDEQPKVETVNFNPIFKTHLYFIWLNKKQNTREGIQLLSDEKDYKSEVARCNELTANMSTVSNLSVFGDIIREHEMLIASVINRKPVQQLHFSDFEGHIKSLGAWGGDFIMAATERNSNYVKNYFNQKGFPSVLQFNDLFKF